MTTTLDRVKKELRNPRKAGLLVLLLAISLLLWGRLLLKRVPRTASAQPVAAVSPTRAILAQAIMPAEPERPVVRVNLAETLSRDLFALDRRAYQPTKDARTAQETEKSPGQPVDDKRQSTAVRKAAAELTLQSVITGSQPRAVINGQMLSPGQRIEGFVLVRIDERFVLVERDGITVRLDL